MARWRIAPWIAVQATLVSVGHCAALVRCFAVIALTGALGLSALVRADDSTRPPVSIASRPIFGEVVGGGTRFHTGVFEVENHTGRPIAGSLVLEVHSFGQAPWRHVLRLDLPRVGKRHAQLTLPPAGMQGAISEVRMSYEANGRRLASGIHPAFDAAATPAIVLLADPPRLRSNLHDLEIQVIEPWGATRMASVPVGAVSFSPESGEPVAPDEAVGWSPAGLVVASAPALPQLPAVCRAALVEWLRAGGELLGFPRSAADLSEPFLKSLIGELRMEVDEAARTTETPFVPAGARGQVLRGPAGLRADTWGGSVRFGFGRVFVASFDGNGTEWSSSPEVRALVHAILARERAGESGPPLLDPAAVVEQDSRFAQPGTAALGPLRSALDPNEAYRPLLVLAALVLMLYVVVVGPLNFAFIERRGRPTLALVTTPVLAALCFVTLLVAGYISKGTTSRYASAALLELVEGDRVALEARYSALFSARPLRFDLEPHDGAVRLLRPPSDTSSLHFDHGTGVAATRGVGGRLWETAFVREDTTQDLGGTVRFVLDGDRLAEVINATSHMLHGAVVVDVGGSVYVVGDVAPGARRPIPLGAEFVLPMGGLLLDNVPALTQLSTVLGVSPEARTVMTGLYGVCQGKLTAGRMPALLARLELPTRGPMAGFFAPTHATHVLRVVPDADVGAAAPLVVPAPAPSTMKPTP